MAFCHNLKILESSSFLLLVWCACQCCISCFAWLCKWCICWFLMDPFQDILDGFKIGASGQSCSHLRKSCRQPKIFLDQWSEYFCKTCSENFWLVMNYVLWSVIKISCSLSMVLLISDNFAGNTCNISYFVYLWSLWILCISSNHMWIFNFLKWFTS